MSERTADVTISCPHCRRQYAMKIDPERLQRLKTRATCGRCGKTFDAASRILAAQQQAHVAEPKRPPPATAEVSETKRTDPKLPSVQPTPPLAMATATLRRTSGMTSPDLRDEMEELAREFAEAAARFTPVGIKRSKVGLPAGAAGSDADTNPGRVPAAVAAAAGTPDVVTLGDAPASTRPAPVEESTRPGIIHAAVVESSGALAAAAAIAPPSGDAAVAALDQLSLDAEPAGEEEFAAAVPTLSRANAAPRSWLELSDPGLAALLSPPSAGAAALEALLNEGESIALPPPPTAS